MALHPGYDYSVTERPVGVSILAVLAWLVGLMFAGLGLLVLLASASLSTPLGVGFGGMGVIVALFGLLSCVQGYGLWRLRPWAWWVAIIGCVTGLIGAVYDFASTPAATDVLSAAISTGIAAYFWSMPIRSEFAGRTLEGRQTPAGLGSAVAYLSGTVILYLALIGVAIGTVIYFLSR